MRNVLCVWALWVLIGLNYPNQPHLGPPTPHPWLQELYLSSAPGSVSWFDLCSWSVCLQLCQGFVWLWLLVIWLWPCFPCLVLDLPYCCGPAWQSQDVWPWLPSPDLILTWPLSSTSSPGTPVWPLGWSWLSPRAFLLTLLRYCGTGLWLPGSQPHQPCCHFQPCSQPSYFKHLESRQVFIWMFYCMLPFPL